MNATEKHFREVMGLGDDRFPLRLEIVRTCRGMFTWPVGETVRGRRELDGTFTLRRLKLTKASLPLNSVLAFVPRRNVRRTA